MALHTTRCLGISVSLDIALVRRRNVEVGGPGVLAPVVDKGVLHGARGGLGNFAAIIKLLGNEGEGEVDAGCDLEGC